MYVTSRTETDKPRADTYRTGITELYVFRDREGNCYGLGALLLEAVFPGQPLLPLPAIVAQLKRTKYSSVDYSK